MNRLGLFLLTLAGPSVVCGLWICQADSILGHAMLQFEQPCDRSLAAETAPVVEDMFVGWYGRPASDGHSVARRTLCCMTSAVPSDGAPGDEAVRCLPDTHEWARHIDMDITADMACDQLLMTSAGVVTYNAHGLMDADTYTWLRGGFLKSRGYASVPLSLGFASTTQRFAQFERVRRLPRLRREAWVADRGNGFVAKLSQSHPLRSYISVNQHGQEVGAQRFTFCCMGPSVLDGSRVQPGDETLECLGGRKFREFQQSFKDPESIPSCSHPDWADVKGRATRRAKDWLSPQQYVELMSEWGRPVPSEVEVEAMKHWETAYIPPYSAVSVEKKSYPRPLTPATTPLLDSDMASCNDAAYHALDRHHESRKSNNPFEGRLVGLRPSSRLSNGAPADSQVVFFTDEERLSNEVVAPFIGERTRRTFIKTLICYRGRHISVPDDAVRSAVIRDLVAGYTDMKYVYLSTIGNVRDYDATGAKGDGLDEGCGKLWLDTNTEQETTCREMVRDAATLARCIGESRSQDAVTKEALRYWTCDKSAYADGAVCNCNCGAWDPDCNAPSGTILSYKTAPALTDCPDPTQRCGPMGCMSNWRDID